ncbi:hypothetical protein [Paraburkholderia youngii]|uniref:hypothetical protein n=1 Tax=Paraburkholderia youngii TaxID=2782701 RepID=UPI003D19577A
MNDVVAEPCATEGCTGTLSFHALTPHIVARAERMVERIHYEVTGLVLADKTRRRMAVVDLAHPEPRWFPETAAFVKMMAGGPGDDVSVPPPEAKGDPLLDPISARAPATVSDAAHSATAKQDPLERLALKLGCFPVSHDDGSTTWGLPGHTTDYANPGVAIERLFSLTKEGVVDGRQLSLIP